jgi:hypothetical protein
MVSIDELRNLMGPEVPVGPSVWRQLAPGTYATAALDDRPAADAAHGADVAREAR